MFGKSHDHYSSQWKISSDGGRVTMRLNWRKS